MAEGTRKLGLSTTAVHGGAPPRSPGMGVSSPLVQSVNYAQETGTSEGLLYTRYGNTPNAVIVQKRLAMLEGAEAALRRAAGRDGLRDAGPPSSRRSSDFELLDLGGTRKLFTGTSSGWGRGLVRESLEPRGWRKASPKEHPGDLLESPVNPTCG